MAVVLGARGLRRPHARALPVGENPVHGHHRRAAPARVLRGQQHELHAHAHLAHPGTEQIAVRLVGLLLHARRVVDLAQLRIERLLAVIVRGDGLRRGQAQTLPPLQPRAHVVHRAAARAPVRRSNRQQDKRVAAAVPAPAVDERQVVRRRRDARAAKARKHLAGKVSRGLL